MSVGTEPSERRKRTATKILAAAALVATVLGLFAAGLFSLFGHSPEPESSKPPNIGPSLDGTFKVDFGPLASADGRPVPGSSRTETWLARSVCRDNGCIATASSLDPLKPDGPPKETMVFDYIDGDWLLVSESPGKCTTASGEVDAQSWSVITLAPRLDGSLSGVYTWATAPDLCVTRQSVTLRPTRDADPKIAPPDPAAQPARAVSPAAGLRGTYTYTQSYPVTGEVFPPHTYAGVTHCLRTGDRCLTFMTAGTDKVMVMVFGDGRWFAKYPDAESQCADGVGKVRQASTDDFPLPHGPQNPIMQLTGKSHQEYTGDCPGTAELDVKLQRTGD